jgi:hypothetical protein
MSSFWAVAIAAESVNPFEEPEEDGLVWLAEQWWTPWAMLAVFTIVGFWMVRSLVLHRGRAPQIERAAAASAMQYREQDGFGLSTVKFQHMAKGEGRGWTASQVVTMEASDGADVHAFDVRSWTDYAVSELSDGEKKLRRHRLGRGSVTDQIVRRYAGATQTAAMAPLAINAPQLVVGRENIVSKVFAAATRLDLDVESEFFNRSYHVIGTDREFAKAVLDAQMIDLMVSTEGKITFEFFGRWLLLHTEQLDPALMPGLARLADQMRQVVPQLVIDRWGTGSPV